MTGRYVRSTFVEHQREFVEHFQYGKQIGKLLDIKNTQKRPQAPKPIFLGLEYEKVQKVDFFEYVRNEAMLVLVFYFFSKTCYM